MGVLAKAPLLRMIFLPLSFICCKYKTLRVASNGRLEAPARRASDKDGESSREVPTRLSWLPNESGKTRKVAGCPWGPKLGFRIGLHGLSFERIRLKGTECGQ